MKILVVEDDTNSRLMLQMAMPDFGHEVTVAGDGLEGYVSVCQDRPDIIVSDILMPRLDGFELCRLIKSDERFFRIVFVFYTGTYVNAQDESLAMMLGADRFLIKPMEIHEIAMELQHAFDKGVTISRPLQFKEDFSEGVLHMHATTVANKLAQKVTELETIHSAVSFNATHDALTGLLNRQEFEQRMRHTLQLAKSATEHHALFYMDLDQFKVVNNSCGHAAGDALLKQLIKNLNAFVKPGDAFARLGGDEFVLLTARCSATEAKNRARALCSAVSNFKFEWNGAVFRVGMSIGVVPINAHSGSVEQLLSAADAACQAAKELGSNRVQLYSENDPELVRRIGEMNWACRISNAIESSRLRLYHRPIVPTDRSKRAAYCKLTLQLIDENGALVEATTFLPAAEQYDLTARLDRWALENGLAWAAGSGSSHELVFMRLSEMSIADESLYNAIEDALRKHNVDPKRLCLEINESHALRNISSANMLIQQLRAMGCRIALTGVSVGMTSLSTLRDLSVDFIGLGSIASDLDHDEISLIAVRACTDIAHRLHNTAIATCENDDKVISALRALGVDYVELVDAVKHKS
ncbi:MAG: diguanylate cyclase [Gammaproteobacteria bacterium]